MKKFTCLLITLVSILLCQTIFAESKIYSISKKSDFVKTYKAIYESMEDSRFYILYEPNILQNLAVFKKRWKENYNRNNIEQIRSILFCKPSFTNEVSNLEPELLAICPLHISLTYKDGITTVRFARPSVYANNTQTETLVYQLEKTVIAAIEKVMKI